MSTINDGQPAPVPWRPVPGRGWTMAQDEASREATGSVIGVDISTGEVFISRWNR